MTQVEKGKMLLEEKIQDISLGEKKRAYYKRMKRLLDMPDLSQIQGHPVEMIVKKIMNAEFYNGFQYVVSPEIVREFETFDLFHFPENHVARRESDSYFIIKGKNKEDNLLLRPHTTVMWYHYLLGQGGKEILEQQGEIKVLSWGKVYRVDELDKTHHECFHQIDGLRIVEKESEIITQETLKEVLTETIAAIYGKDIQYRFHEDFFPYTQESLEVEVWDGERWIEILGAGIVHPTVLEKLGIDSEKYNGWAFGFGIDRLAMALKKVPDIRILWSDDERITRQWGDFAAYNEVSSYPAISNDISFLSSKNKFVQDKVESEKSGKIEFTTESETDSFEIAGVARDIGEDLIEEVRVVDVYENDKKFGKDKKSITIRVVFRSLERTLENTEINRMYLQIREKLEKDLGYILR